MNSLKSKWVSVHSAISSLRLLTVLALMGVLIVPLIIKAASPSWWASGVIDLTKSADDYAAVNQGQLKNIAKKAMVEMDAHLPGGAGAAVHGAIDVWGYPINTTNDYMAVNLGQLKQLAAPFYQRLKEVGYITELPSWMIPSATSNDYSAANIGQVKNLFAFDLVAVTAENDTNHDGLPDWWEQYYFHTLNVDPNGDPDGDGQSNLREFRLGMNPFDYFNVGSRVVFITSPASGLLFSTSTNIYVSADFYSTYNGVAKIEFYADSIKIGESLTGPYGVIWSSASVGSHMLTAVATDENGSSISSLPVYVTVANFSPQVTLISKQSAYTQTSGQLTARVTGVGPQDLAALTLNGKAITPAVGQFDLSVSLTEGDNQFTLIATDNQGRTGQATINLLCAMVGSTLNISEPLHNSSIKYARINVTGTVNHIAPLESLTVNGLKATISGNSYTVLNVPIVAGANTLIAKAKDIAGNISTSSINVTGITTDSNGVMTDPLSLQSSTQSGSVPLAIFLTPLTNVTGTIYEYKYDFDGDGIDDHASDSASPISHSYESAGEFYPVVTIKTTEGSFSSLGGFNAPIGSDRLTIKAFSQVSEHDFFGIINPVDIVAAPDGNLYVLSGSTATLTEFNHNNEIIRSSSNIGLQPTGIDIDKNGNVYVVLSGDNQVVRLKPSGASFILDTSFNGVGYIGSADKSAGSALGVMSSPSDVAVSSDGTALYVSDTNNNRIEKFTINGRFLQLIDIAGGNLGQLNRPKGLCSAKNDVIFASDFGNNRIVLIDHDIVTATQGTSGTEDGQFNSPLNISRNKDGIYVADTGNNRVVNFAVAQAESESAIPTFSFCWSSNSSIGMNQPNSIACGIDPLGTTLYVADTGNNRIIILKVARNDTPDAVWHQMQVCIAAHDFEGAIACFSEPVQIAYRNTFRKIGAQLSTAAINDVGPITPISIGNDDAEYSIAQNVGGRVMLFPLRFIRENGRWKIQEF